MSNILDFKSSLRDPESRKFETFSYLPPMDNEQIKSQVEYIVAQGWNPGSQGSCICTRPIPVLSRLLMTWATVTP